MQNGQMDPNDLASLIGADPAAALTTLAPQDQSGDNIQREVPEIDPARKAAVAEWASKVKRAKKHWEKRFKEMRKDQDFVFGRQWTDKDSDERYVANITLRLIQQRTAFLYAKNPKFVARRRERLLNTVWDGNQSTLDALQAAGAAMAQQAQQQAMSGMPPDPNQIAAQQQQIQQASAIAADAAKVKQQTQQLEAIAKTLELLYSHNIDTQTASFKQMMKMVVRRACTNGVAYVKLGFERAMEKRPEVMARIADVSERLSTLERLSADIADGQTDDSSPEMFELQSLLSSLKDQSEFVAREGLLLDYPQSTAIIPDTKTIMLKEFLGADWVAQEYPLSVNEVKEIYSIDVGSQHTSYVRDGGGGMDISASGADTLVRRSAGAASSDDNDGEDAKTCIVWEIYSRKDGLVYIVCDGYPDFLRDPAEPEVYTTRFWPWYPLTFNDVEHEDEIIPPSDVKLVRDMQKEYNRMRQGLREHRKAARPKTVVAGGMVDEEDLDKLANHPDNAIIELNGLQPGQKVEDLLQAYRGPSIDPNLYETEQTYNDVLRVTGIQEANLGGTSRTTATQTNVAEASRTTAMGSNIDDIDDLLTQLARSGGQILLQQCSVETVQRIVGPGAVWPELSREQVADEIWLEIEAGSTGRPNQAQEIANAERIFPIIMQIPGINPEFLAKELLRRLDDRLDLTEAFKSMLPSIVAMNAAKGGMPGGPPGGAPGGMAGPTPPNPMMQGGQGGNNAPRGPAPGGHMAPDAVQQLHGNAPPPGMGH